MNNIGEIRIAKNNLNRSLNMNILNNNNSFEEKLDKLILKTPTGDLRNIYTELNILYETIKGDYETLIKLHQI